MNALRRLTLLVSLASAAVAEVQARASKPAAPKAPESARVGDEAPAIDGSGPDGNGVSREHLRGKVVLLVFWTLDPATKSRMPLEPLRELRRAFRADERFLILTVCLPNGVDESDAWLDFVARQGKVDYGGGEVLFQNDPSWWNVFDFGVEEPTTARRYGVEETPAYFLIGDDGRLDAVRIPRERLRATVEASLRHAR